MEIALVLLQLVIELFKDTIATIVVIFLVWAILAVATSGIQDWISSLLSWRAFMLEDTIEQMLGNSKLKDKVYSHPLIRGFYTNQGKRKPRKIPHDKFVLALFHEVLKSGDTSMQGKDDLDELKKKIAVLKHEDGSYLKGFAVTLETLLIGVNNIAEAQVRVESWLNDSLIQLSGAYRRRLQAVGMIVGILIALAFNVDTVAIANSVWRNPAVRVGVG